MINSIISKTYTPPSMKRASRAELSFLHLLRNGLDVQFDYTTSWLISSQGNIFMNQVDEDNFDEEFDDSQLYAMLSSLIMENAVNGTSLLSKFYRQGSRLGYYQLRKGSLFGKSDKRALDILTNYVQQVVQSINAEYAIGIKETIKNNIDTPEDIRSDLIKLAYIPILSAISVDARCRYTARTEYGRAVNTGTAQAYANYGVDKVDIVTAGDDFVCDECIYYESHNPYTLEEAMQILPVHPNCRCSIVPYGNENWTLLSDPIIVDLTDNYDNMVVI